MSLLKQNKINNIVNMIQLFEENIVSIIIILLFTLTFIQVLTRNIFLFSFYWIEEISGFLFVYLSLLGTSLALRSDEISKIDLLTRKLRNKERLACQLIGIILTIIVLVGYSWGGIVGAKLSRFRFSSTLNISWMYIYSAFPVGMILLLEQHIRMFFDVVKELKNSNTIE